VLGRSAWSIAPADKTHRVERPMPAATPPILGGSHSCALVRSPSRQGMWRNGRRARFRSVFRRLSGGSTPPIPTTQLQVGGGPTRHLKIARSDLAEVEDVPPHVGVPIRHRTEGPNARY